MNDTIYNKTPHPASVSDLLMVSLPVVNASLRYLTICATEANIDFILIAPTTIFSPVSGTVERIEFIGDYSGWCLEISNETSITILSGIDVIEVDEAQAVAAGERIGVMRYFPDNGERILSFHIASRFVDFNLQTNLKVVG